MSNRQRGAVGAMTNAAGEVFISGDIADDGVPVVWVHTLDFEIEDDEAYPGAID